MDKKIFSRLMNYVKKYSLLVVITCILALINVAATLVIPVFIGKAIDCIIGLNNVNFNELLLNIGYILIFICVVIISQWLMNFVNNKITYDITKDIRKDAMDKIQILPLSYIDAHPYGEVVSKVITDVDTFADGLLMGFTQLFSGIATILGTLVLMFIMNWIVALIVVVLTPISLFTAKYISSKIHSYFVKQSEIRGEQTAFIDEMVNNLKVVQAFSHEDENLEDFEKINKNLEKCSLKAIFYSSTVNPTTRMINAIIYALVALSGAFVIVTNPLGLVMSVGNLATMLSYANQYTKPFNEISGVITELQNALACFERVVKLINEEPQIEDVKDAHIFEKVEGNIEIDNLYFSYDKNKKLLQDVTVHVKKGQHVAIVGPTGCGKTTLINLLMRFYDPDNGTIKVDNFDTKESTRESLRKNFGMVLQETWLKNGTIRDNLKIGKEDATDEEIIEACKASYCHNFITKLENGYDTIIGEDGGALSQGQKQLLCIARIMLIMPPMLILDEATSSIDTRTELKIQDAFNKLMKNKTTFIVAHRLSTIKQADIILVMKDGNIIETGNHEELLSQHGFYYTLYNSQFEENN